MNIIVWNMLNILKIYKFVMLVGEWDREIERKGE